MIPSLSFLLALTTSAVGRSISEGTQQIAPAFQTSLNSKSAPPRGMASRRTSSSSLGLATSDIILYTHDVPLHLLRQCSTSIAVPTASIASSILLSAAAEGEADEWRQYVPLVVSVGVILDIVLGSPVANAALGPMKRASERGAGGENSGVSNIDDDRDGRVSNAGSVFSTGLGGSRISGGGADGRSGGGKERVDSEAIARAALNKAINTLELKRFLEENKTDEQRYDEVRKKIDRQLSELDVD
ncbi:hypothetical protein ACHAXA_005147 [Cyclostephanos tholiformis]|jgi:hypothetical protein|uniref:Uncharacterized protein n=1 Tax=Cyclostephanos tholiformis TaxID=382380 RepID=A0ABD3RXA4_9STRA